MKLYEITGQLAEVKNLDDLDEKTMADTLEGIEGEFEEKAKSIGFVARNIESDVGAIDAEIARLNARKKTIQNREKWMRDYLKQNMQKAGITKIEHPLFVISITKGRDVVEITDIDAIPDEFVTVNSTIAPDKRALLAALKKGPVSGAAITKSSDSLRIK